MSPSSHLRRRFKSRRDGQAMVEFMVALVAALALFAGLIQIMTLGNARSEVMDNARREAGERAVSRSVILDTPDYIKEWREGGDLSRYSADDESTDASEDALISVIVDPAAGKDSDWLVLDHLSGNELSILRFSPSTATRLGLVMGKDSETVALLPAVKHLLYGKDEIDVESVVWMPRTTGIY